MNESGTTAAQQDGHASSARDMADLARAGYVIVRQPLMEVSFEVHHVADRPGYLADVVKNDPAALGRNARDAFAETLTSAANGVGLVVVTRTGVGVGTRRQLERSEAPARMTDTPESRIFRGAARPNPSFIYESAWRYEGIVCIDAESTRVHWWHSRAILDLVTEIAKMAKGIDAPILSLQAPAQVPLGVRRSSEALASPDEEMLDPASSLAVRFAIALEQPSAARTLELSEHLRRYCAQRGFGFWLADTRQGRRAGNWFEVDRPSHHDAGSPAVKSCIPITFVGPARVGSTHAIVSFLRQYRNIGIAACSVTSLDDLAFIHLQLVFNGDRPSEQGELDAYIDAGSPSLKTPFDVLSSICRIQEHDREVSLDRDRVSDLMKYAGDYESLAGPRRMMSCTDPHKRMAIWFSWQTQGTELDLAAPLQRLLGALADVKLGARGRRSGPHAVANVEYLICRNMGNAVLRGKGKLSVPRDIALRRSGGNGLDPWPTNLCVGIEEAWRARVARSGRQGVRELTVAWRECWLGHWSSLPRP